jgi:hypothetical protein
MPKTDLTFTGGEYAPVADRVRLFYQQYPTGRIVTHLVRRTEAEVVFRAEVFRTYGDRAPAATGWAAEREGDGEINTVACLENTETSAVGRALANLGLVASARRPSREEMEKADRARARPTQGAERPRAADPGLQRRADRATDVLTLLTRAARLGLSVRKSEVLRASVTRRDVDVALLTRVERRLRDWLERRSDRVGWR